MNSETKNSQIDFTKYRTPELIGAVLNLVDIRGIYVGAFRKVVLGALLLGVVGAVLFWYRTEGTISFLPALMFCVFAGGVAGLFLAFVEVIRQSLGNMMQIADLLLQLTKTIAADIASMGGGDVQIPGPKELVSSVYRDVFLPTVVQVIRDRLGWIGVPVLFLYRMTLARVMRFVIKILPEEAFTAEKEEVISDAAEEFVSGAKIVASNEQGIVNALEWTRNKLHTIGDWFRFIVMIPCYVIFVIVMFVIMAVLTVFWFGWGPSTPPTDAVSLFQMLLG